MEHQTQKETVSESESESDTGTDTGSETYLDEINIDKPDVIGNFDENIDERLKKLEYFSDGDVIDVFIVDTDEADGGNKITITFSPPVGDTFTRTYSIPRNPSTETDFTRLLSMLHLTFDNADEMMGESVPAVYTDDEWEIQHPEPDRSTTEKLVKFTEQYIDVDKFIKWSSLSSVLTFWPFFGTIICGYGVIINQQIDGGNEQTRLGWIRIYLTLLMAWSISAVLLLTFFGVL